MKHYAAVTVGENGLFYPHCGTCGWTGRATDSHDVAREAADEHSDPEALAEMQEFEAEFSRNPFTQP